MPNMAMELNNELSSCNLDSIPKLVDGTRHRVKGFRKTVNRGKYETFAWLGKETCDLCYVFSNVKKEHSHEPGSLRRVKYSLSSAIYGCCTRKKLRELLRKKKCIPMPPFRDGRGLREV